MEEETQDKTQDKEPRVQIGPHPLGGIAVSLRDLEGNVHQTRIDLPEATILSHHLVALITMAFNSMYAEASRASQVVGGR